MSMIIFYVFLTAESKFDICFSPSRLDFAAQEVEIFAFLYKAEKKILSKSGMSIYFGCTLMYFWTMNPKKTSELTYHAYILIFRRF